jgi:hypothetical protein
MSARGLRAQIGRRHERCSAAALEVAYSIRVFLCHDHSPVVVQHIISHRPARRRRDRTPNSLPRRSIDIEGSLHDGDRMAAHVVVRRGTPGSPPLRCRWLDPPRWNRAASSRGPGGAWNSAPITAPPARISRTGTSPAPSSSLRSASGDTPLASSSRARTTAVPTVGWPANAISLHGCTIAGQGATVRCFNPTRVLQRARERCTCAVRRD